MVQAHTCTVCRKWRCVVLSSSSRLHARLLFAPCRPPSAIMLTRLPPLPIIINYGTTLIRSLKEQNGVAAALRYPDRVRKIAITGQDLVLDKVYGTMNHPFPTLETFELFNPLVAAFEVPTTIFKGSAPSLRHLYLENVIFASVYQLLSSTTCLVELNSDTDAILCLSLAASLLTHLQGMPCLRRRQPHVLDRSTPIPVFNMRATDIVPLPKLTHFRLSGYMA